MFKHIRVAAMASITVLAAAASVSAALASPATASASLRAGQLAARGPERIQIMSTSTRPGPATAIASGAFTAAGRAELGHAAAGTLVFSGGMIKLSHKPAKARQHITLSTCLNVITQSGTYKILGGTRAYAHIAGHGTYRLSLVFVSARAHGACSATKPPVAEEELIQLTGPTRL